MKQIHSFILIVLLLTTGCNRPMTQLPNGLPGVNITSDQMNKFLRLSNPKEYGNSHKNGDWLDIDVDCIVPNISIAFKPDFGAQLFVFTKNGWLGIENTADYELLGNGYGILPYSLGDPFKTAFTSVVPSYADISERTTLRVVLIGFLIKDEKISTEQVAGYIDTYLIP